MNYRLYVLMLLIKSKRIKSDQIIQQGVIYIWGNQLLLLYIIYLTKMMEETYDSFGFRRKKYSIQNQSDLMGGQQERASYQRWQLILPQLGTVKVQKGRELIEIVRIGIPNVLRAQIWPKLLIQPIKQYQYFYAEYKKGNELKQINLDLDRTMPNNKNFSGMRQNLKTVLNTIAIAFPQMGYCQGLNFIAANLLLVLDQKNAFNAMHHILYWQRHELLMTNLETIHRKLYCLQKLIKKHFPKLFKSLKKCQSGPLVFTSSWFITLFNNILPYSYAFRILQCYFLEGDKILYRVALQILKQKKKIIKLFGEEQDVISQLTKFKEFDTTMIDRFFNEMFQIQLSRKQIDQWENQFEQKK